MDAKDLKALRIVSLLPSATEILCRLGLEQNLVGISHECDYPETVQSLPRLTSYDIDFEQISKLAPDLVVTQDQTPTPHTLDDIHRTFTKLGKATNREQEAEDLVTEFWIKLNRINSKVGTDIPAHPKVLCLEWLEPLRVAGGWIPEIVKLAGGVPLIVTKTERFREISWGEIEASNPDFVFIFPCGYPIAKTLNEIQTSSTLKQISSLRAFKEEKVFVCDGNHLFNRPGPRIAESCELLASLLHPAKFEKDSSRNQGTLYINLKEAKFL